LFRTEGGAGLFKGLLAPMLTAGGLNSIFFGVYAVSLQYIQVLMIMMSA